MSKKSGPARGPHPSPAAAGIAEVVPWSAPVTLDQITDSGLHREIEAPETARAAVARLAGLREVSELSAAFDLSKTGSKVHVSGRVRGRVARVAFLLQIRHLLLVERAAERVGEQPVERADQMTHVIAHRGAPAQPRPDLRGRQPLERDADVVFRVQQHMGHRLQQRRHAGNGTREPGFHGGIVDC